MDNKNQIIELVVYRLKGKLHSNRDIVVEKATTALASLEGFLYRKVYRATDDPTLLFDFVAWSNLENAVNATKNMDKIPGFQAFVHLIEKTEHFAHYSVSSEDAGKQGETQTVELVIYELKADANHQIGDFFDAYTRELTKANGYRGRILLHACKTPTVWAEQVFWSDVPSAIQNTAAMQQNNALRELFSSVEQVLLLTHFTELK